MLLSESRTVTFVAILTALLHARFVTRGRSFGSPFGRLRPELIAFGCSLGERSKGGLEPLEVAGSQVGLQGAFHPALRGAIGLSLGATFSHCLGAGRQLASGARFAATDQRQ